MGDLGEQLVRKQYFDILNAENAVQREKAELTNDPAKLRKAVYGVVQPFYPATKLEKGKFVTELEAMEAATPSDHPSRGLGERVVRASTTLMQNKKFRNMEAVDIIRTAASFDIARPTFTIKDGQKVDLLTAANMYKRKADTSIKHLLTLGMFGGGEDDNVKKPPGYDRWLGAVKKEEAKRDTEGMFATPGEIGAAAAINAAIGGGITVATLGGAAPAIPLMAATGAVGEIIAHPFFRLYQKSDWATARQYDTGATAWMKRWIIPTLVYGIAGGGLDKMASKAFLIEKNMLASAMKDPSAGNWLKYKHTKLKVDKIIEGRFNKEVPGKVGDEIYKTLEFGLNPNSKVANFLSFGKAKRDFAKAALKDEADKSATIAAMPTGVTKQKALPAARFNKEGKLITQKRVITVDKHGDATIDYLANQFNDLSPEAAERAVNNKKGVKVGITEEVDKKKAIETAMTPDEKIRLEAEKAYKIELANGRDSLSLPNPEVERIIKKGKKTKAEIIAETKKTLADNKKAAVATAKVTNKVSSPEEVAGNITDSVIVKEVPSGDAGAIADRVAAKADVKRKTLGREADIILAKANASGAATPGGTIIAKPTTILRKVQDMGAIEKTADLSELDLKKEVINLPSKDTSVVNKKAAGFKKSMKKDQDKITATVGKSIKDASPEIKEKIVTLNSATPDEVAKHITDNANMPLDPVETINQIAKGGKSTGKGKMPDFTRHPDVFGDRQVEGGLFTKKGIDDISKGKVEPFYDAVTTVESQALKHNNPAKFEHQLNHIADLVQDAKSVSLANKEVILGLITRSIPKGQERIASNTKLKGITKALSYMGVTAGAYDLTFNPSDANAGVTSAMGKEISEVILRKMLRKGWIVPAIKDGQLLLRASEYQIAPRLGGPQEVIKIFSGKGLPGERYIRREYTKGGIYEKGRLLDKVWSPYALLQRALVETKGKMRNFVVDKVLYQNAEYNNVNRIQQVLDNIFKEAGIPNSSAEIQKRFKPLIPFMEKQVAYEFHSTAITKLELEATKIGKRKYKIPEIKDEDYAINKREVEKHRGELAKIEGSIPEFHKQWEVIAKKAAIDLPSVRIALAIGDTANFDKYTFLKGINFTEKEKILIGRLKAQSAEYAVRLKDMGEEVIAGPYHPHSLHPDFQEALLSKIQGENELGASNTALMKFYKRSPSSRPLLPDVHTNWRSYVSQTERRIQNMAYWNSGWADVEKITHDIPIIADAFRSLREGVIPYNRTTANKTAELYAQFEVFKRLWGNPSAGLKHLVKVTADLASVGFKTSAVVLPRAAGMTFRRVMNLSPTARGVLSKLGYDTKGTEDLFTMFATASVPPRNTHQRLLDLGISTQDEYFSYAKTIWHKMQTAGSAWINLAELFDRGMSVAAGLEMTGKKGMTAEQAMYGVADLIVKNNFLSREFNPGWLRNPKCRAVLLFQATPFKIFDRRLAIAIRSSRVIKDMGRQVYEATKTGEGRTRMWENLKSLRKDMKEGERLIKSNMFADALASETDFFGTPVVNQFAKDIAMIGAGTYGGAAIGLNLKNHFFHFPGLSGQTSDTTLALSPFLKEAYEMYHGDVYRTENDDEWLFNKFLKGWMGPTLALPEILNKAIRLSNNDIPERYNNSGLQYLFAVPSEKKKE